MGSKGGGFDAGPMLEYGQKALNLQKQMYNDSVERSEPYYNVGTSGLGMLADFLGLQGGSVQSRDQIYNDMKGDYTTTQQVGGNSSMFITPDGRVVNVDDAWRDYNPAARGMTPTSARDTLLSGGYKMFSEPTTQTTIDTQGLNAAVDARMAEQGNTPDYYGSLLEGFDESKFRADPGYQFRLDEGQKAIERAAAARGQYYDPSTVKALNDYNSNQADQTYNQAYDRYNIDQNNIFNRLAAVSGIGQTATSQMGASGQNYANQAGNIYGQMGNAITSAQVAQASQPSMFDTLLSAGTQLGGAYLGNPMMFM